MTEPIIGLLIILFINIFGLAIYFLIFPFRRIRKKQKQAELKLISQKEELEGLSKKIREAGRKLSLISEVKKLETALREGHKKNYELEMEIKRLKHNLEVERSKQPVKKTNPISKTETEKIKQKYPALPKNQLERIEIERSIARSLMKNNGGSFHISQILKKVERLYTKHIKSNDRITLFNEIKRWVDRDPLCKIVKTIGNVQHYTFI